MPEIKIVPMHGRVPGRFQDNYLGDVRLYPPTKSALDWRGRRKWSIWTRNSGDKAVSYHSSEKAGLKAMRKIVDVYYDPTPAGKIQAHSIVPIKM